MRPTDGRAITNPENAQNFSHAEIKQAADQMNPAGLDAAFAAWSAIAAAVTKAGDEFETAIQKAIDQRWEGAAAAAAVRGIREYATRVGELGESLAQQSDPLSSAASAATGFKAAIPPVAESSANSTEPAARNSQEEQARDDMYTYYIQPYGATAPEIPTLPEPVNPVSVPGTGVTPIPSSPAPQPGSENGTPSATKPVDPTGNGTPAEAGTPAEEGKPSEAGTPSEEGKPSEEATPAADTPADTTEAPGNTAPQSVSQNPGNTFPAAAYAPSTTGTAPQSATMPAAAVAPGSPAAIPQSAVVPNSSAASNPSTAPNAANPLRPGTSVPAHPAAQNAPVAPAAAGGRVATPGAPGYAGMMPPRGHARGEDDGEHKSAKYLRTKEHTKELLGETEKTVPPALGAD
ncbi:hypothetical protein [Nocardia sp. XZ_19_385]|uniref:PPE domain-containing protein n=1 Tax=Nocardia sp. XZ_19_385 TaxID=2769488 RepID=UPI00188E2CA6|nr:hypothetical protein [Nocardia sp. XZ_19_385]